ncbi:hypothetical protein ES705_08963 [subsurface metagenome]
MNVLQYIRMLKYRKRGSPILEEILLIGIAVLIFVIIFGIVASLLDWTESGIKDFFS